VGTGLITSYAQPGGNVTGTSRSTISGSVGPKLLDLLRQVIPGLSRVAVVYEMWSPSGVLDWHAIQAAAQSSSIDVQAVGIAEANDLERALETALAGTPQALITAVAGGTIVPATNQPAVTTITGFALQHALPTAGMPYRHNTDRWSLVLWSELGSALPPCGELPPRSHPARGKAG
jgi:ABC transporter substrate binding protein